MSFVGKSALMALTSSLALSLALSTAFAGQTQGAVGTDGINAYQTAEFRLIEKTQKIEGEGSLNNPALREEMKAAVAQYAHHYDATPISIQQQTERFKKAMVAIGLYTPGQATAVMNRIAETTTELTQGQIDTTEFAQQIQTLAEVSRPAMGAQFSITPQVLVYSWIGGTATGIGLAVWGFHSGNTALGVSGIGLAAGVTGLFMYIAQGA